VIWVAYTHPGRVEVEQRTIEMIAVRERIDKFL
jgi:hypothetical protein